jgi:hypothetical protein
MQRRTLLKLGVGSAAALALLGGGAALMWQPGLQQGRLTAAGRTVFKAVARAVLQGALPAEAAAAEAALQAHLKRMDATVAAFPPPVQAELSDLLALLALAPGRRALAGLGTAWDEASAAQVAQALNEMRHAGLALRQQAYHALRDLTHAAWFSAPEHWALLGYPGPRPI